MLRLPRVACALAVRVSQRASAAAAPAMPSARCFSTADSAPAAAASAAAAAAPVSAEVGLTGGAPDEFVRRTCRVYKPSRSATQQGPEYRWKIEFDTPNKWVNPLMGWTSARDTAQQLRETMWFNTEQEAVEFASKEGFHPTVLPYHAKKLKAKSFSDNFKWKGPPKKTEQ